MGLVCSCFSAPSPSAAPLPAAALPSSAAPPSAAAEPSSIAPPSAAAVLRFAARSAPSAGAAPPAPEYYSPRIAEMIEKLKRNPKMDKVESEVEASKVAWSEVTPSVVVWDELAAENLRVFRSLQAQWPDGLFKGWTERQWELGEKIAEGGQAELFELWRIDPEGRRVEKVPWVIKMFKEGLRLHDLQRLLPRGMLVDENTLWRGNFDVGHHCNAIQGAMLFNGKFAIMMERKWGDLRKLIDARMIRNNMQDYECSVGVVGTGFWMAPEILLAMENGNGVTPEMFTNASDVYSYAMTCYEIITGHIPFEVEGFGANDYDRVIDGCRPSLPSETPHWMKELLSKCWHKDPLERSTFEDIEDIIVQHRNG